MRRRARATFRSFLDAAWAFITRTTRALKPSSEASGRRLARARQLARRALFSRLAFAGLLGLALLGLFVVRALVTRPVPPAPVRAPVTAVRPAPDMAKAVREAKAKSLRAAVERARDLNPADVRSAPASSENQGGESVTSPSTDRIVTSSPEALAGRLRATLAATDPDAAEALSFEPHGALGEELLARLDETPVLLLIPSQPAPSAPPLKRPARVAIVIDDLGPDLTVARRFAELPAPLAFAIMPGTRDSTAVARLASSKGMTVMLHMPTEPAGYPRVNPGPRALLTGMRPEEIAIATSRALAEIPRVQGVNNHMGSRFTENPAAVDAMLSILKPRNLFFLDSMTSQKSVAARQAQRLGLTTYKRDVFLDNVQEERAVLAQLRALERAAMSRGHAVAIGHPYPETLAALRRWLAAKPAEIVVVPLTSLPALGDFAGNSATRGRGLGAKP